MSAGAHQADEARRRRLRWRARRGLLENDLVMARFFDRFEASLTDADVAGVCRGRAPAPDPPVPVPPSPRGTTSSLIRNVTASAATLHKQEATSTDRDRTPPTHRI